MNRIAAAALILLPALAPPQARCAGQDTLVAGPFPFNNTHLAWSARADDLVARMTLKEKIAQMQNNAPAIPQ